MANLRGYQQVERSGRRMMLHRWIMEQHLGRKLAPWEFVHHIDGNKSNNALENLQLISPEEHGALHAGGNRRKQYFKPWNALPEKTAQEILRLRAEGHSYSEIGRRLHLHNQTVRGNILRRNVA